MEKLVEHILKRMKPENRRALSVEHINVMKDFDKSNNLHGLTITSRKNYIFALFLFARTLKKEYKDVTKEDIIDFLNSKKANSTKESWRITLKKFYKWLYQTDDYPPIVKELKSIRNCNGGLSAADLLQDDDTKELLDACDNHRDKTMIAVLNDLGIRLGELLNIKIGDITNDGHYVTTTVHGKTGSRPLRLSTSAPMVTCLLNEHPQKDDKEAYLFYSFHHSRRFQKLSSDGFRSILKQIAKRTNIKKRVHPHNFRHKLATYLANYMSESELRIWFGWSKNSDMPSYYIHLTNQDVNDRKMEIDTGEKINRVPKPSKLLPLKCVVCGQENSITNRYCTSCMNPLHPQLEEKYKNQMDSMQKQIQDMSEKMELISEAINSNFGRAMIKNNGKPRVFVEITKLPDGEIVKDTIEAPPFHMDVNEITETYSILKNRKNVANDSKIGGRYHEL